MNQQRAPGVTRGRAITSAKTLLFLVAFALQPLAHQLPIAPFGFGVLARASFRGFLVGTAKLHFPENAFTLHFLLQRPKRLIDIIVAYDYLNDNQSPRTKGL